MGSGLESLWMGARLMSFRLDILVGMAGSRFSLSMTDGLVDESRVADAC